MTTQITLNPEQQAAVDSTVAARSICLIGAAGTGKTTTLKTCLRELLASERLAPLSQSTENLRAGAPGVVLVSYTRRAVRNIAKQMDEQLKSHCMTIHKLLEFGPVKYEEELPDGTIVNKMRFEPSRNSGNPLPRELTTIVIDEASMVSTDLFDLLMDALPIPSQVQFIFLGDLNQLPPIYGMSILGVKLLELPIIELTRVYRQALESPIIALALAVKNNNFASFNKDAETLWKAPHHWDAKRVTEKTELHSPGRGKVTLVPWKTEFDAEYSLKAISKKLPEWINTGFYSPDEDLMLCPWNESFGTVELNKHVAQYLGQQRGAEVWEVIAGFNKYYLAVGDKMMVEKQEAIVYDIQRNNKYLGVPPRNPSKTMDRWGKDREPTQGNAGSAMTEQDIDDLLEFAAESVEDRTAQSSAIVKVRILDTGETLILDKAAQLNNSSLGYAITVHKAQGSEARKVIFLTAKCHAAMLSRELVYTAITRAQEELVILHDPTMFSRAASRPRIKGDTLKDKLEFFLSRLKEKL